MVHQEVSIPKGNSLASQSYTGAINGIDVTKNLMVDPSNSTKNVVYLCYQNLQSYKLQKRLIMMDRQQRQKG
jgi:hypothetical protein